MKQELYLRKLLLLLFCLFAFSVFIETKLNAQVSAYAFSQSVVTYTAITGGTVLGNTTSDDQYFVDPAVPAGGFTATGPGFPIGFNFTMNGSVFDRVGIQNNGWIGLGQSALTPSVNLSSTSTYTPLSSVAAIAPIQLRSRIAGIGRDIQGQAGSELRIETIGSSPNRVCVIQFTNYRKFGATGDNFSFQIRLSETSNLIDVVYNAVTFNATTNTAQVGLGGSASTDFNNRSTTTDWNNTTAGGTNAATCTMLNTVVVPVNGRDYTWTPPPPCTGTPAPGNTLSSANPACSGVNFTLSLQNNPPVSGLTYQWQSSPNGSTWTDIGGATSMTLTTSQTVATYYRSNVTCGANTGTSTALQVTMNLPSNCYCSSTATSAADEEILNVTLGTLNNTSTCASVGPGPGSVQNMYSNYTSGTGAPAAPILVLGNSYPFSVQIGTCGGNFTNSMAIWIDFNQNGVFDAVEKVYVSAAGTAGPHTESGTITVPAGAVAGNTRMRVVNVETGTPTGINPCGTYTWGETEDYNVNIFIPPCIITCPANIVVSNDPNQCGAVVNYPAPTTSGVCGPVTTTPASGSFFPVGTTTVTATEPGGGICTFTVRVNDTQPPTITTCPANITVGNTAGQCGAIVNFTPTAADNCPGVTITSVPASGSLFPKGTTTVTSTVRDASNNTATCTFTVTVNDTQAPTITCPATVIKSNDPNQCGAIVNYPTPAATDNCPFPGGAPLSITQSSSNAIVAGSVACNAGGFHTDNSYWRAYDLAPLALSGPFIVNTVTFGIELANAAGTGTTQPVTVRLYTSAGAFPGGVRTLVGSQAANVPDQTLSLFTVTFTTPPTVPANAILVVELFTPNGQVAGHSFFIGSNTAAQTGPSYISAADCGIATPTDLAAIGFPNMHIVLNAAGIVSNPSTSIVSVPASGSFFPVGNTTVTSTVTDASGNTATCSFTVRVNDTQAPAITCPVNIIAPTPVGLCTAVVNYAVTATDNCPGVTVARTAGPASGSAFPLGVTTITYRATDAAANTSTCSFTVTVNDVQLPVIGVSGQPTNQTACVGSAATFAVVSTNAVSYQWQQWNGTAWVNIAGATSSSLTLSGVTLSLNTNTYRVNVIGLCTTVTSAFATLYVNALPTITLVASQAPILIPGQHMSITAVVSPTGGTIVWTKVTLTGTVTLSNTSLTLSGLTVDDIGTYRAVYTDPNGCRQTSADLTISAQLTDKLWVYPNPNSGQFQVRFFNQVNEPVTLNIYDSKGARVYSRKLVTTIPYTPINVDLGRNSSGSYIVEIRDSKDRQIGGRQVVIQH